MHMHMRCRRPPGGKAWRVGGMRVLGYLADALTLAIVNFALSAVAYITLPTFDPFSLHFKVPRSVLTRGRGYVGFAIAEIMAHAIPLFKVRGAGGTVSEARRARC